MHGEEQSTSRPPLLLCHVTCASCVLPPLQKMWSLPETLRVTGRGLLVRVSMVLVTKLFLGNSGVGVDPPLNGHTDIHMYTKSPSYVSQDLEC